ncbi:MAG: hypothetical protein SCH39_09010 [Methanosarcinales archaeon]|nr:hypothetical protein [Methanosarcinales archaeon]
MEPEEQYGENRRSYLIATGVIVALIVAAGIVLFNLLLGAVIGLVGAGFAKSNSYGKVRYLTWKNMI